jgi:hypothetical protein
MSASLAPLDALAVTNQCVAICDLAHWQNAHSAAWRLVKGTQDDVGRALAGILSAKGARRLDDFGGVCKTFLCEGEKYLAQPPRTKPGGAVFSFTPKNRLIAEGHDMARVCAAAGYAALILTVQKHGKFGKVWVLCGLLRQHAGDVLVYYEDTSDVVDELKSSPEASRVCAVHVQVPGFEAHVAHRADRVIDQHQYRREVLEP